jgi:hypothetical protein
MGITITNSGQGSVVRFRNLGRGGVMTSTSVPGLLNKYPGAVAAYSLRKLDKSYTGSAIRVRRSSDNAEQDIRFVNNQLDTESLATFAGYQNLTLYSDDYSNVYWTKNGGSIATNSTQAPDGTTTADKFAETSGNEVHRIYENQSFSTGYVYTYSVYLKYIGRRYVMLELSNSSGMQVIFDIQNGLVSASVGSVTPISTSIESVGNGWYRCSVTFQNPSGTTIIISGNNSGTVAALTYAGLGGDAFFAWGSQLNVGYKAQPYQKTTSATNIQYITKWYDQSGNSLDAVQATTANQPQILIAPQANISVAVWHGSSNHLTTSNTYNFGTSISTFWTGRRTNGGSSGCFFGDNNANFDCRVDLAQIQTGGVNVGSFGAAFDSWALGSVLRISTASKAYINNVQSSTTNTTALSAGGIRTISIGRRGLDTAINLQGWNREIIIYNSDQSSNLTAINANINSFYSIY